MSRFKRAFDVAGACAGLIVFLPVMAVAATAVFIDASRLGAGSRAYTARWNPLLDCRLIALSFAVNLFGKARVQERLRRSTPARAVIFALMAGGLFAGCSSPVPSEQTTQTRRAELCQQSLEVQSSNAVASGQLYVFLSEGTLVIASSSGTPTLGTCCSVTGALSSAATRPPLAGRRVRLATR